MRRKIVRVGASLCILLPKDVIKTMEWDFGDPIDLILDEENEKVILRNIRAGFLEDYKDVLNEIDPVEVKSD